MQTNIRSISVFGCYFECITYIVSLIYKTFLVAFFVIIRFLSLSCVLVFYVYSLAYERSITLKMDIYFSICFILLVLCGTSVFAGGKHGMSLYVCF